MIRRLLRKIMNILGLGSDIYLLKSIKHSGWIQRAFWPGDSTIPVQRFVFAEIDDVSEQDIEICRRLIRSFEQAIAEGDPAMSPMWQDNVAKRQKSLHLALENKDSQALASVLSSMLRSEIIFGIDLGSLYTGRNWRVHSLKLLDDLVSLAEYLGVTRTESGQGTIGHAFSDGVEVLVRDIESSLGISIGVPTVGGPYGIKAADSLISLQSPEYVYAACRLIAAKETYAPQLQMLSMLEIGAGYGGTAYFLFRLLGEAIRQYTIIDLPWVNVMQGYYLAKLLGAERVQFYGEDDGPVPPVVRVLPPHALEHCGNVDILFNENSMPEFPVEVAQGYLSWAQDHVTAFFFSYNRESLTANREFAVTTVPEVISSVGGFKRLSRTPSWARPGYVEEIYVPEKKSS